MKYEILAIFGLAIFNLAIFGLATFNLTIFGLAIFNLASFVTIAYCFSKGYFE
jgi:hypothetical protein